MELNGQTIADSEITIKHAKCNVEDTEQTKGRFCTCGGGLCRDCNQVFAEGERIVHHTIADL